jgi:RNA polymerase subunit RPABC4/transcription elongation factor Spt4
MCGNAIYGVAIRKNMGKYSLDWTATCPKCDKVVTPDMLECSNCGKGKIKTGIFYGDRKELGCDKCITAISDELHCPSCNARIASELIQVVRPAPEPVSTPTKQQKEQPKKWPKWKLNIVVFGSIMLIMFITFLILGNSLGGAFGATLVISAFLLIVFLFFGG